MLFTVGSFGIACAVGWLCGHLCRAPASIWDGAGLCFLTIISLCAIELDATPSLVSGALVGFASVMHFKQSIRVRAARKNSEESLWYSD